MCSAQIAYLLALCVSVLNLVYWTLFRRESVEGAWQENLGLQQMMAMRTPSLPSHSDP